MNRNSFVSWHRLLWSFLTFAVVALFPGSGHGQIVINEIVAANATIAPLSTHTNYFPDYIELLNTSESTVDLAAGQWTLSNKRNPDFLDFKDFYFFPEGTVLPAGRRLLVFFDGVTNVPGLHTSFWKDGTNIVFTLKASGDRVQLYQNFTGLVDSNIFGPQITDKAIGRVPDGSGNFTLTVPSPCEGAGCAGNVSVEFLPAPTGSNELSLKINEWLALNVDKGVTNSDWFEIYNPDTNNIVSMGGLIMIDSDVDDVDDDRNWLPPLSFIAPGGHVQLNADSSGNDPDTFRFSLSSTSGDELHIFAADQVTVIDKVVFGPLTTANISRGRVPDGSTNIITLPNLSPGARNFGRITEIVISEVLPHTDLPLEDAIELQNVTDAPVDISHWWLTNDEDNPKKFRIPAGTIVEPGGFAVFYEGKKAPASFKNAFNRSGTDKGRDFTLNSSQGDEVYLFKGRPDGTLTGDRVGIDFGPSENGVSFGRYVTSSLNNNEVDYVAMSNRTFGVDAPATVLQFRGGTGKTNAYPKIGPVVITELVYDVGTIDEELYEFIELRNVSDDVVLLYDPAFPTNQWRLKDGVSFTFPPNQSIAPDEYILVVNFNPQTNTTQLELFKSAYPNIPENTRIYGPYSGSLNNSGDRVELARPDRPQAADRVDAGLVPYFVVDRVDYNNNAPWPEVENTGQSLQRINDFEYGNDPSNWKGIGEFPTPGRFNSALGIEPPRITAQPHSQTNGVRYNVALAVRARGGERIYQWFHDNEPVEGGTNASLEIIGVSLEDAGAYQVAISNIAGLVTSEIATLTVTNTPADVSAPTVTITSPANNVRILTPVTTLRGTATDNIALDHIEYRIGDGAFERATGFTAWEAEIALAPGTNRIVARAFDTSGNSITSKVQTVVYVVSDAIDLSVTGNGTISGVTDGQLLEVGRNYTITATPAAGSVFSNWTGVETPTPGNPRLTFTMVEDMAITANFVPNPFSDVDGKFNGLFYDSEDLRYGNSGFFTLTVTERGSYTGTLTSEGRKYPLSGQLNLEGRATNNVLRPNTNGLRVTLAVALDDSDRVTGTVENQSWTADLQGDRAVFSKTSPNTSVGKFTFVIPGTPGATTTPEGDSYGTVSIDANGMVTTKGFLADKTTLSQKVPLSKNGEWPFFASLYGNKGSVFGWLSLTNDADEFVGDVNWSKPALATSKYYPGGFNELYSVTGSRYVAPPAGNRVIDLTGAAEVALTGGNLAQAQTNSVTLGTDNKVVNGTPAQKLVFTLVLPSGLFKGNFTPVGSTRSVPIAGAILQNVNRASGYFLGTNRSGRVLLHEPAP